MSLPEARPVAGPESSGLRGGSWRLGGLMLLAGVVHTGSFAPFDAWPLQLLALIGLALAVQGQPVR
ncbi:MAG: hypothetical protein WA086_16745, partial [Ideonella sp.]